MVDKDNFTPTPHRGMDPVSRALNEFYLELNPTAKEPYVGVKLHLLRPDTVPDVDLYVKRGMSFRLFRVAREPFSAVELRALLDAGIEKIHVKRESAGEIRDYLETFLTTAPH